MWRNTTYLVNSVGLSLILNSDFFIGGWRGLVPVGTLHLSGLALVACKASGSLTPGLGIDVPSLDDCPGAVFVPPETVCAIRDKS